LRRNVSEARAVLWKRAEREKREGGRERESPMGASAYAKMTPPTLTIRILTILTLTLDSC
jgi:hypothetical protein